MTGCPRTTPDERADQHERAERVVPAPGHQGEQPRRGSPPSSRPSQMPDAAAPPSPASPGPARAPRRAGRRRSPARAGRRTRARRTCRRRPASRARSAPGRARSPVAGQPGDQDRDDGHGVRRRDQPGGQQPGPPVDDRQRDADGHQRQHHEQRPAPAEHQPDRGRADAEASAALPGAARAGPRCRRTAPWAPPARPRRGSARRPRLARARSGSSGSGSGTEAISRGTRAPRDQPQHAGRRRGDGVEVGHRADLAASASSAARRIAPAGTSYRPVIATTWLTAWATSRSRPLSTVRPDRSAAAASGVGHGS